MAVHAVLAAQIRAIWITACFDDEISYLRQGEVDYDAVRYEIVPQTTYQRLRRPREAVGLGRKYPEYVDTILKDLGLSPWGKASLWKENFEPY